MNLVKIDEDGNLNISNELWLFKEFKALKNSKYLSEKGNLDGRQKLPEKRTSLIPKHLRTLKYFYLTHHPKMKIEFEHLSEKYKIELNLEECKLDTNDLKDKVFKEAEQKFIELSTSLELQALDSCRSVVHTVIETNSKINTMLQDFLLSDSNIDEIDSVLKKSSIVMDNVNKLDKLLNTLNTLKDRYKKQFASEDAIRGEQEEGLDLEDLE